MITGTLILLSVLFVIVLIHEAGHLIVAKKCGVGVKTFSIGFGPRLIGIKFFDGNPSIRIFNRPPTNETLWELGETEYRLAPIPFGGFCAMEGEMDGEEESCLVNKPYLQKVAVAMGGAFVNIVTGFIAIASIIIPQTGFFKGLKFTVLAIGDMVTQAYTQTVALITGQVPLAHWNEIAEASAQMASFEGIVLLFGFYSIILALFNLLPFPALDGSLPLLWGLEYIFGKKTGRLISNTLVNIGFTLLMGLQIFIILYWIFF